MNTLQEIENNYRKYKWFFTSSGKLVVGGKSAEQNDELLSKIKKSNKELVIMHTQSPGSPFSVILADVKKVSKADIEECAIFTGCFSRAWKLEAKKAQISIFRASQVAKSGGMKTGTWGVLGKAEKVSVNLQLVLAKQDGVLRAIPEKSVGNKKDILLKIAPGKVDKKVMSLKLQVEIGNSFSQDELLAALPAGGVRIVK